MKHHTIIAVIFCLTITLIALFTGYKWYKFGQLTITQPPNPREFGRIEQLTPIVRAGEKYKYRLAARNLRTDCKGDRRIRHLLNVGNGEYRLLDNEVRPDPIFAREIGKEIVNVIEIDLPTDLRSGIYRVNVYRAYHCPEGLRSIAYWTPNFEVVRR